MNTKENYIKLSLWASIAIDIILVICFVLGFALGLCSVEFGFLMVGYIFRFGAYIVTTSIIMKILAILLCIPLDTNDKRGYFTVALSALFRLVIVSGLVYGIYYIGKVMTEVG